MLIFRRREGESFQIGENIRVQVLTISDGSVRLAIEAPKEIPVLRSELLRAMDVNRDAANEETGPQELLEMLAGLHGGAAKDPHGQKKPDGA